VKRLLLPGLLYGLAGGALIAALRWIEYQHVIRAHPGEIYGGLIALIFTAVGVWGGLHWNKRRTIVVREVVVRDPEPFQPNLAAAEQAGLTPREKEILTLIAAGHSNREIADQLFVSENTVKTHSSRVFDKLRVRRRVQAVQKARELGLIP
jgi:NarL family two-component system response regulator LiaR